MLSVHTEILVTIANVSICMFQCHTITILDLRWSSPTPKAEFSQEKPVNVENYILNINELVAKAMLHKVYFIKQSLNLYVLVLFCFINI